MTYDSVWLELNVFVVTFRRVFIRMPCLSFSNWDDFALVCTLSHAHWKFASEVLF